MHGIADTGIPSGMSYMYNTNLGVISIVGQYRTRTGSVSVEYSNEMLHLPRGFGHEHHSTSGTDPSISGTEEYQHVASILSIVITGTVLLGVVCIIIRTLLALRPFKGSQQDSEDNEEEVGGAKRTRAKLCIALLVSDAWVGISWLAPAAMDLKDEPLQGNQCQIPGTTLATALWWQYGFSVAIAVSTYLALRHPLSRLKDWQERKVGLIICGVVLLGSIQAIMWQQLHGYTNWGQFCYYGSPHSRLAEAMQFLPRLLSSFTIAIIYAVLVRFLRRPTLTARCIPSPQLRSNRSNSAETLCEWNDLGPAAQFKDGDDRPPWEKIHLPDFSRLADEDAEKDKEKTPIRGIKARLGTPDRTWLKGSSFPRHGRTASNVSEATLVASPRPLSTPAGSLRSMMVNDRLSPPTRPQIRRSRPSTAPSNFPSPSPLEPAFVSMKATLSLPIEIERDMSRGNSLAISDDSREEISSFRGMLMAPSPDSDSLTLRRPSTPALDDQGIMESRADVLNKQTWKLLIWYPLTVSRHSY